MNRVPRPAAAPAGSLSARMRVGSAAEHTEAEASPFMAGLLDGRLPATCYADYLLALAAVYGALEGAGRALVPEASRPDPLAAAVWDPVLERGAALDDDLRLWVGEDWRSRAEPGPAVTAYARELAASREDPLAFVAHHYTRYLGDLSGGQAIGRIITRTYGLEDGAGTAFYRFPGVPKPKLYKDSYRARLDALGLSEPDQHRVVEHVRAAFAHNQAVFAELAAAADRRAPVNL
ncbi:MAG: biliverdin-producing heme oxygenase [Nocardioides sp.]|nr:biliverdin-producing heme oxygenase [Nocardioides sp.]